MIRKMESPELFIPFKVLVIQHDPGIANQLERELSATGFSVQVERNPNHAIDAAIDSGPDLIILDLELPRLPGTFVVRKLRKFEKMLKTPIVGLSLRAEGSVLKELQSLGVKHVLKKPMVPGLAHKMAEQYYKVKVIADISRGD